MQKWVPDATFNYRKYLPYKCPFPHEKSFLYKFDDSCITYTQDIKFKDRREVNKIRFTQNEKRYIDYLHGMDNCSLSALSSSSSFYYYRNAIDVIAL